MSKAVRCQVKGSQAYPTNSWGCTATDYAYWVKTSGGIVLDGAPEQVKATNQNGVTGAKVTHHPLKAVYQTEERANSQLPRHDRSNCHTKNLSALIVTPIWNLQLPSANPSDICLLFCLPVPTWPGTEFKINRMHLFFCLLCSHPSPSVKLSSCPLGSWAHWLCFRKWSITRCWNKTIELIKNSKVNSGHFVLWQQ